MSTDAFMLLPLGLVLLVSLALEAIGRRAILPRVTLLILFGIAVEQFPQYPLILPVVIASTVLFELIGPLLTRFALQRAGRLPGSCL